MPTSNKKKVFAQMMKNPKVEISGMAYGKWIRIEAEIAVDSRREALISISVNNFFTRKIHLYINNEMIQS